MLPLAEGYTTSRCRPCTWRSRRLFRPAFASSGWRLHPPRQLKLVDRVIELDPGALRPRQIRAEMDIDRKPGLTCHFVDDRVMPGT
jgi:3-hydroxymyristoyl/3-hydroxydecanoyl-(acyl carrier protein) dehydratase